MQEIEAKFYVQDLRQIETRIQRLGARLIQARIFETNIRFDLPDGGLRSEGRVLRLRQDSEARLTYKGSGSSAQGVVSRTEIEFTVEDFNKARLLLEALGYQSVMVYEKYRTIYELETCHIMLDEMPYGQYVEIEGTETSAIHAIARQLQLNLEAAIINASYAGLFERIRKALALPFTDLTFENFKGITVTPAHLQVNPADMTNE
jgi:adenylate cyclase, class 2